MKTLYLLRHAKSDRDLALDDKVRPLNERGRRAAPAMAAAMAKRGYRPDYALVSSAERTRATWQLMASALGAPPADARDALYLASAATLVKEIQGAPSQSRALALVGHNPGIADLAARLAAPRQAAEGAKALKRLSEKFPTCGLAVFELSIDDWRDTKLAAARLVDFLTPKDLED